MQTYIYKYDDFKFPFNYRMVELRLVCVEKKFARNSALKITEAEKIDEHV